MLTIGDKGKVSCVTFICRLVSNVFPETFLHNTSNRVTAEQMKNIYSI